MCKFPWTRRAEAEREKRREAQVRRIEAQERLVEIEVEGVQVQSFRDAVSREIALNDWTRTAKDMFRGRD